MQLAKIQGHATGTICHPTMKGVRLLLCETLDEEGRETGKFYLSGDFLGAGLHDTVLVTSDGDAAERKVKDPTCPLRNVIVGIVDPKEDRDARR